MALVTSDLMVGGRKRPDWAGLVTISDNKPTSDDALQDSRNPRQVRGIVVPVTTAGRPSPPSPWSGYQTGKGPGTDKGHLMALELGGPDIAENIVPQSSRWQQSGGWRIIEVNVLRVAMRWMGIDGVYDPSDDIPAPASACYFAVAPGSGADAMTGEPLWYDINIAKVSIFQSPRGWSWDSRPHQIARWAQIAPNEVRFDSRDAWSDL